ncbi:unnamed protein product [Trifolium pratense]|uniref:Uncharacterized protein n=1 Tax=Trifolium pratense TaxID=57577 RepID=A0ACB0IDS7_TRIPR|nr:unnamed protein product [Trifolium pratense]
MSFQLMPALAIKLCFWLCCESQSRVATQILMESRPHELEENMNRKGNTWRNFLRRTTSSSACVCQEVEMSETLTCLRRAANPENHQNQILLRCWSFNDGEGIGGEARFREVFFSLSASAFVGRCVCE